MTRNDASVAQAAKRTMAARRFVYERVGYDQRLLELLPDFRIGAGADRCERRWELGSDGGGIWLAIHGDQGLTCKLREAGGIWQGRWVIGERMAIRLRAPESGPPLPRTNMIGMTIAAGEAYLKMAGRAADVVRKRAGLTALIVTDDLLMQHPTIARLPYGTNRALLAQLFLFDFLYEFIESIFYFDADTLMLADWDVAQYGGRREIVAVRDLPNDGTIADCRRYGLDAKRYFNTGIMVINRSNHAKVFRRAQELHWLSSGEVSPLMPEQTAVNRAAQECGVGVELLDERYNFLNYGTRGPPKGVVIAHAAGGGNTAFLRNFHRATGGL